MWGAEAPKSLGSRAPRLPDRRQPLATALPLLKTRTPLRQSQISRERADPTHPTRVGMIRILQIRGLSLYQWVPRVNLRGTPPAPPRAPASSLPSHVFSYIATCPFPFGLSASGCSRSLRL